MSSDLARAIGTFRKTAETALDDGAGPSQQFLYDTAPIGLAFLSPECRYLRINRQLTEICGISIEEHLGRTVHECVPALGDAVEEIVRSVIETGEPVTEVEVAGQNPGDSIPRFWMTYWHPVQGPDGSVIGVNVAAEEITLRKEAEAALQASEQQFRTLANSIPQLVWMSDATGAIFWFNRPLAEFSPLAAKDIAGGDWLAALGPDCGSAEWERALAAGEPFQIETLLRGRQGGDHIFLTRVVPLPGSVAGVDRWIGTHIDIGEIRQREAHIKLIADELSHRSKNLLTVVLAIARQTSGQASDVADYHARLSTRLAALAKCSDLLVGDNWQGTLLEELVNSMLEPFGGARQERIEIEGPPVMLQPGAVQQLGLALYELATNASKYGALSQEAGRVSIRWMVEQQDEMVTLRWREAGGPPVSPPMRRGFGTVVIDQIVPRALGGRGKLEYPSEGLSWTFDFPVQGCTRPQN